MASADIQTPNLNVKRKRDPMLIGQQVIDPERIIGTPEWQARQNALQARHASNFIADAKRRREEELAAREERARLGIKTRSEAIDGVKQENPLPDVTLHTKARGPRQHPDSIGGMGEVPHARDRRKERERNKPRRPITEL
jgi:hypothetical protein